MFIDIIFYCLVWCNSIRKWTIQLILYNIWLWNAYVLAAVFLSVDFVFARAHTKHVRHTSNIKYNEIDKICKSLREISYGHSCAPRPTTIYAYPIERNLPTITPPVWVWNSLSECTPPWINNNACKRQQTEEQKTKILLFFHLLAKYYFSCSQRWSEGDTHNGGWCEVYDCNRSYRKIIIIKILVELVRECVSHGEQFPMTFRFDVGWNENKVRKQNSCRMSAFWRHGIYYYES